MTRGGGGSFPIIVSLLLLDPNVILLYCYTKSDNMTTHSPGGIWVLITLGGEISLCIVRACMCACGRELMGCGAFAAVRTCPRVRVMLAIT